MHSSQRTPRHAAPQSARHLSLTTLAAALSAALAALAVSVPAQAQSNPEPTKEAATQEVTITATRRVQAMRDVPMAVDAIPGKDLERLALTDAKDIAKIAPGVEMTNNDGRQNVASMRGVSFNPDTGVPVAAVGVFINEVPVSSNVAFNALYDLGQVEVLRGPQGTLRGQMSPAGAITMSTRRPEFVKLGGEFRLSGDDRGGYNVQGAFNLPVISDQLAVRFAAVRDHNRGNQVRNLTNGDRSESDTESYRLNLAWQVTPDLRLDLMSQALKVDSLLVWQVLGDGNVLPFNLGRPATAIAARDYQGVADTSALYKTSARLSTAKLNWSINDHLSLSFIGSLQSFKLNQGFDRDVGNVLPATTIWQQVDSESKTQSAEVVLASEGNPFWNFALGAYYDHTDAQSDVDVAAGAFTLDIPSGGQTRAVFTRQTFTLAKGLTLEGGLRYSEITSDRQSVAAVPGFTFPSSIPAEWSRVVDKPVTWSLSLSNAFNKQFTGYVAAARTFRSGTYQIGLLNPVDTALLGMPPEKSDALELGMKGDFLARTLTLNAALFTQRYRGYIDYVPDVSYQYQDFTGATQRDGSPFNSSGDAKVSGIELQAFMRPSPQWDITAGASWVRSRYTSGTRPCDDSNSDGIPDNLGPSLIPAGRNVATCPMTGSIAELPRFSFSGTTEYRFAMGGLQPYVGMLLNHRPGFHSEKINRDYEAFTNVSLFAGVRSVKGDWEVGLVVKNALDQQRVTSTTTANSMTSAGDLGQFDSGYRQVVMTNPRTVGLTARYAF